MSEARAPKRRRRDAPRKRVSVPWAALVAAGLLGVGIITVAWMAIGALRWLSPTGNIVTVPAFVGSQYAAAQHTARAAHLSLSVVAHKPDFHAPKDRIVGQLPAAGERVREGRVIDVVLSDGEPMARVPNVANMSVRDATVAIENAHLDVGTVTSQYNAGVAEATVLSQQPDALTQVSAGTKVDLVVARGRPIAYAPNFVGLPETAVPAAAKEAHVDLAPSVQMPLAPSAPPKGTIVSQDPVAGQQLRPGERITLNVSGGAIPANPSPGMPLSAPGASAPPVTAAGSPAGAPSGGSPAAAPRGIRVSVAIPQLDQAMRVRVVLVDATGSRTLYDQVSSGGQTLTFDFTVTGTGTLQTFIADQLTNSTSL